MQINKSFSGLLQTAVRWVSQSQGRLKLISFPAFTEESKSAYFSLALQQSHVAHSKCKSSPTVCSEQEKGTQTTEESMTSSLFCFFFPLYKTFFPLLCIWAILIVAGWEFPSGSWDLRLNAFTDGGPASIPGQGTKIHKPKGKRK